MNKSHTRGTVEYFVKQSWCNMNTRAINGSHHSSSGRNELYKRNGIKLLITRDNFKAWCIERKDKIEEMYRNGDVPSIDRVDSSKHYSFCNIQLLEYSENRRKAGILGGMLTAKKVKAVSLDGKSVYFAKSKREMALNFGFDRAAMNCVLNGKYSQHRGFTFEYVKESA